MKNLFISLLISLLQINISPAVLEWSGDSVEPKSASISVTGTWQADSLLYSGVFRLNVNSGTGNSVITVSPVSVNTGTSDRCGEIAFFDSNGNYCLLSVIQHGQSSSPGTDPDPSPDPGHTEFIPQDKGISYIGITNYRSSDLSRSTKSVTYYNGLGDAVEQVELCWSPQGFNLVTPVTYDNLRRPDAKVHLPYVSGSKSTTFSDAYESSALSSQQSYYSTRYSDAHPYTLTEYGSSPVGRVKSIRKAGNPWAAPDKRSVISRTGYRRTDSLMRLKYVPSPVRAVVRTDLCPYMDSSLTVVTSTNEEGRLSRVYTDPLGRTLCIRTTDGSESSDTYFVYDIKDSLICVVQPEGSRALSSSLDSVLFLSPSDTNINSVIYERWCFSWKYDGRGNPVEYHVPGGGTTYLSYDERGRLVSECSPRMSELGLKRTISYDNSNRPVSEAYVRTSDNRVFPSRTCEYYGLDSGVPAGSRGLLERETLWPVPGVSPSSILSQSRSYYYDSESRIVGLETETTDDWYSLISMVYDYAGNLSSVTEEVRSPHSHDYLQTRYSYDSNNRKISCSRVLNGIALSDVTYSYDELGRLSTKLLGPSSGPRFRELFQYDIHGWLTSLNAQFSTTSLFAESLYYSSPAQGLSSGRYDGLLSGLSYKHYGQTVQHYGYTYDNQGRLSGSDHKSGTVRTNACTERNISYDLNGNLLHMTRYSGAAGESLNYVNEGNRVVEVNGNGYGYDTSGNLTLDESKGLQISYNVLNLVDIIHSDEGSLKYTYLSDGTKLSCSSVSGHGYRYMGSFVFMTFPGGSSRLESIGWDEGRIVLDTLQLSSGGRSVLKRDEWHICDHLGNVRSVVDLGAGSPSRAVLERNDYLPYGLRLESSGAELSSNRYRYSGKEELRSPSGSAYHLMDFGARYYDSTICRWTGVDPLAYKSLSLSPFNYCNNNPVNLVDPDGRFPDFIFDIVGVAMDVKSLVKSIQSGDSKDILTDVGALVVDVVAAAVPIVPGGAGAAVSALRKGDKIVDGVKSIDKSTDSAKSFALRLGPKANKGVSRPHGGEEHNSVIDMVLEAAVKANANPETLRKNQKQVDAKGFQRGNNRPDFQFDIGDIHYSGEVDYSPSRSENHGKVIRNNDPNTVLIRMLLKK